MKRMREAIVAMFLLACVASAADYYRQLLTLPRTASAGAQTKTWAFLYHFDETPGTTGPFADQGISNIVATGNNATVIITNDPAHTGFGYVVATTGQAKRVHIGPEGLPAPGTNDFFVEGWFYLSATLAATNVNVSFIGDYTNTAAGYKCFIGITKGTAHGGRFDILYSTNGAASVAKALVNTQGSDMSSLGNSWVHLKAGRLTNAMSAWINGQRQFFSSAIVSDPFVFTNAGVSLTAFTIGGRTAANSPVAADEVGYWIGPYSGDNFIPPTAPRTGFETSP